MGTLPFLSVLARRRYDVVNGQMVEPNGFPPKLPATETALIPALALTVRELSPTAKLDRIGRAIQLWRYELPPMEIMTMLIAPYHVQGAAPIDNFPYKLKAVGRVDANKIMQGGKGLVSDDYVIIP